MTIPIDFKAFYFDVKQDIETYIDWDVDVDYNIDITKDIDVWADVDIDVKDSGAVLTGFIKDISPNADGMVAQANTSVVESLLSQTSVLAGTANVTLDLSSSAMDYAALTNTTTASTNGFQLPNLNLIDSATFTEIDFGVDNVYGKFTTFNIEMQALVDGGGNLLS